MVSLNVNSKLFSLRLSFGMNDATCEKAADLCKQEKKKQNIFILLSFVKLCMMCHGTTGNNIERTVCAVCLLSVKKAVCKLFLRDEQWIH